MLLAIDAGNSNIKFAVFDGSEMKALWRIRTEAGRTTDEYTALLSALFAQSDLTIGQISGVAMMSVVPVAVPALQRLSVHTFHQEPLLLSAQSDLGLVVQYQPPNAVGADRLADAVAAVSQYGAPCIVIDFGTATTYNAVVPGADGIPIYLGGAIAPGIDLFLEGLSTRAAKLFTVEMAKPPHAIGNNTEHALQSGLLFGYVSQVAGMVTRFQEEMQAPGCPVIATGGHAAGLIASESSVITAVEPLLTLTGLRLVYERSQKGIAAS